MGMSMGATFSKAKQSSVITIIPILEGYQPPYGTGEPEVPEQETAISIYP